MSEKSGFDAVFVGGGVIGLASAWRAAQSGARVCVLERSELPVGSGRPAGPTAATSRGPTAGTTPSGSDGGATPGLSHAASDGARFSAAATDVAAGMLAPVGELTFGERDLLGLTLASSELWPEFAAEVEAASGESIGYQECGALHIGLDRDEAGELRRRHDLQTELGLGAEWLTPRRCRELEPGLTPSFAGGVLVPSEASVDPRRLALALAAALRGAGGELRTGTEVVDGLWDGERLVGVRTAPTNPAVAEPSAFSNPVGDKGQKAALGEPSAFGRPQGDQRQRVEVYADAVVLCNGSWSGQTDWLPDAARPPVRPVKGETVELRARPDDSPPAERIVCSERVYLVPRPDGRLIVGATVEERGFDTAVTAGGVHELLREAYRVLPDVAEMEFVGAIAGLRPGTPDNLPIVGRGAVHGLVLATGHFRNGILLAPLTADVVAATLTGAEPPVAITPADPSRKTLVTQRVTRGYGLRDRVGAALAAETAR